MIHPVAVPSRVPTVCGGMDQGLSPAALCARPAGAPKWGYSGLAESFRSCFRVAAVLGKVGEVGYQGEAGVTVGKGIWGEGVAGAQRVPSLSLGTGSR